MNSRETPQHPPELATVCAHRSDISSHAASRDSDFPLALTSAHVAAQAAKKHTSPLRYASRKDEGTSLRNNSRKQLLLCDAVSRSLPTVLTPISYSGVALAESGRLIEAASELAEAVRLGPGQAEYTLTYANVLSLLKQNYAAAKVLAPFEKQARLDHLTTPRLWLLHDIYMRLLREDEALRVLDRIGPREPGNPRVQLQRAKIYRLKQQLDLAEATLKKILGNPTSTAAANYELAKILQQRKETTQLEPLYSRQCSKRKTIPSISANSAVCVWRWATLMRRSSTLSALSLPAASFPQIYYVLGQAYLKKGEREKGTVYLKKVQELNAAARQKQIEEQQELTFITMGEELLDKGNVAEAKALFERAHLANPKNWHANEYLAKIALNMGDSQQCRPVRRGSRKNRFPFVRSKLSAGTVFVSETE